MAGETRHQQYLILNNSFLIMKMFEGIKLKVKLSGHKQSGFTLLSVLFLMVVFGISLVGANTYWSTTVKREKEAELIFRGDQIRKAIESYYNASKSGGKNAYPRNLESLLKDPRSLSVKKHLRKMYLDPMSKDGEWGLITVASGGIKGVYSKSNDKPLKISNFSKEYIDFEKAKSYSDWRFVYDKNASKQDTSK